MPRASGETVLEAGEAKMQGVFEHDTVLPPREQIDHEEREELRQIRGLDRL
ncbi:hypothetical protein [Haloterrigena salifodinae]|uniref:hypothetical protein n=1 Tax=Haloterrigena salifodinae TaxID=2675099 RepID=UPI0020110368|nr:hypothetical protein [Haloterrigena salifodinae]